MACVPYVRGVTHRSSSLREARLFLAYQERFLDSPCCRPSTLLCCSTAPLLLFPRRPSSCPRKSQSTAAAGAEVTGPNAGRTQRQPEGETVLLNSPVFPTFPHSSASPYLLAYPRPVLATIFHPSGTSVVTISPRSRKATSSLLPSTSIRLCQGIPRIETNAVPPSLTGRCLALHLPPLKAAPSSLVCHTSRVYSFR